MMNYTYDDIVSKLKKLGYVKSREGKGSHTLWCQDGSLQDIVLPNHGSKTLSKGVISSAIKQTGLSNSDFLSL